MTYILRRSQIDPEFVEILQNGDLVQEIKILFAIKKFPSSFSSLDEALEWIQKIEKKLAKDFAYRLLAMKNYPTPLLIKKLKEKKFSQNVIEELIEELKKLGYLQDENYVEALIEKEIAKGYGPRYIEMKLRSEGLDSGKIKEFYTEKKQRASLNKAVLKLKGKEGRSAISALLRRGFDFSLIEKFFLQK